MIQYKMIQENTIQCSKSSILEYWSIRSPKIENSVVYSSQET